MSETEVRVRFAPSPTGFLHMGGARTAIYDWLLAKHTGGKFILRIEDTDRNRFVPDSLADIMDSLHWLGLDYDEGPEVGGEYGPYFQSERLELYQKYAAQLIAEGKAYYCFCTGERLQELRKVQESAKQQTGYDRLCRTLTKEEVAERSKTSLKRVIRFKTPLEGKTVVEDLIRGEMIFENHTLEDLVLIKSDGFPTYHFANVVDDHLMKISHVLRGDEWIASTPIHVLLYQAFGWQPPAFSHLSIFLAPDGGKLSKRHGATSVKEYREQGYLSEALFNFLLLLGWNPGTEQELFTKEEAAKVFSAERINASPVKFSTDKLNWYNGMYIRNLEPVKLAERCLPYLQNAGLLPDPCPTDRFEYLVTIMPLVRERMKFLTEAVQLCDIFLQEEIPVPTKELLIPKKMDQALTLQVLEGVLGVLQGIDGSFKEADLEAGLRELAQKMELHDGQIFMPVRVAYSGRTATPGIFESLHVLGKERTLRRIKNAIEVLK